MRAAAGAGDGGGDLLGATLERVFADHCAPADRRDAEDTGWADACWQALDGAGLLRLGVPEAAGGAGGTVAEAATLLLLSGRHAVPLPVAEGSLLAGWFAETGLDLPPGVLTVAPLPGRSGLRLAGGQVTGSVERVPWGARSDAVLAVAESDDGPCAVILDPRAATARPGANLAGEPRAGLTWGGADIEVDRRCPVDPAALESLELRGVLARALMTAGAMQRTAELTIHHARSRSQFGRPIAGFQAVAHRLVQMTAESELVVLAATVAARRFEESGAGAAFEVLAAGSVASAAVGTVTAHAHQVHGAVGMTREHELQQFTRRLWSWRDEWGSERRLALALGDRVVATDPSSLWGRVVDG